jgi:hypothetical protein
MAFFESTPSRIARLAPSYWHRPAESRRTLPVRQAGNVNVAELAEAAQVAQVARAAEASRAVAAGTEAPAAASPPEPAVADQAPARLYRWIRGSRVPADVAADAGSFLDPADRRPGERPRWAL